MSDATLVKLRHSAPVSGVSWAGQWYVAFNGQVSVPAEAVPVLCALPHRWTKVIEPAPSAPANVTKLNKRAR